VGQAGAGNQTDMSTERHAEAARSFSGHVGSPAPSLVVLHPGAPQRHSQIVFMWPAGINPGRPGEIAVRSGPRPAVLAAITPARGIDANLPHERPAWIVGMEAPGLTTMGLSRVGPLRAESR